MDEIFNASYLKHGYKGDVASKTDELLKIVQQLPDTSAKKAIVFDFDETLFHNARWWPMIRNIYDEESRHKGDNLERLDCSLPLHSNVLKIVSTIKGKGYTPFIITSRHETFRDVTVNNLAIYNVPVNSEHIYLYNAKDGICVCEFKLAKKREILLLDYIIVLNIGDQESDLLGDYNHFKMPAFYTTPCQCSSLPS